MKLMIKVFIVFASVMAIAFYFLRDQPTASSSQTNNIPSDKFETLALLPNTIEESSGIELMPDNGHFITHNDAGNQPHLYEISEKGKLVKTHKLNLPNVDWEDLSRDDEGNLYIGDTGNNDDKRRELAIYKVNFNDMQKPEAIRFTYEDQKEDESKKDDNSFDCEAFFWSNSNLYLITKDRAGSNEAKVYQLPDEPGTHVAKKIGSIKIKDPITGAAISPDQQLVALLSEGKLHLFRNVSSPEKFFNSDPDKIDLHEAGQTEAVTFKDGKTLILTNEGGSLFRYTL